MRISIKDIRKQADYLNKLTGSPSTPYKQVNGRTVAQIGNYNISEAYGGVCLHRIINIGGGLIAPVFPSHIPKKEAFNRIDSYIKGIEQHGSR